jgi:hypothetical protein
MSRILIAVDPGASGGVAVKVGDTVSSVAMPESSTGLLELFNQVKSVSSGKEIRLVCERVGGFVGMREIEKQMMCPQCKCVFAYRERQGDPGSTMFVFGKNAGIIEGMAVAMGFRYEEVGPRDWQKCIGMKKEYKEPKNLWKNRLKDKAKKLFPSQKRVTLNTSDALCILEYAIRTEPKF